MASASEEGVTLASIRRAAKRLEGRVHQTPLMSSESLTRMTHHDVLWLKCENLQKTGSFKIRGATNAVAAQLERNPHITDFVTHSSGNHGQALAFAARSFGKRAHVICPDSAPAVKRHAMAAYGAHIVYCRATLEDRMRTCDEVMYSLNSSHGGYKEPGVSVATTTSTQIRGESAVGAVFVHPFDDDDVISGQGTVGLEILQQVDGGRVDAVVVPVGGGGLASGVAIAIKQSRPDIAVFLAEPEGADDTYRSFHQGTRVLSQREGLPKSIADGLLTLNSDKTFGYIKKYCDGVLRVSEVEIKKAMYLVYERCKVVIEPSAAVGVGAVLACPEPLAPFKRVAVVMCGGNVDVANISQYAKL